MAKIVNIMKPKTLSNSEKQQILTEGIRKRREKWRLRAIELFLQGNSQNAIKEILTEETGHNFGSVTIGKYVKGATDLWHEAKNEMVANHKEIELVKINRVEAEYWGAWEQSKKGYKNTTETKTKADSTALATSQIKTDKRAMNGDPRFLEGVLKCIDMRNKLLGMEIQPLQINQQITNVNEGSKNVTYVRRVVFKTRETETKQVIEDNED